MRDDVKRSSQGGFSLIEIMIAAALLAGLTIGFMTMTKNALKGQNFLKFTMARSEIRSTLFHYVQSNAASCACSMKGTTFNPTSIPTTIPMPDLLVFADSKTCGSVQRKLMYQDLQVDNAKVEATEIRISAGAGNSYSGAMIIRLKPMNEMVGAPRDVITIPIDFPTTDSGSNKEIAGCMAGATEAGITFNPTYIGDTHTPLNGSTTWSLTKVPVSAQAVLVKYVIGKLGGSGKGDREIRKCSVNNTNGDVFHFGHSSHGDGQAHSIAGSTIINLGIAPHSLNFNCNNSDSGGYFEVYGIIN